MLKLIAKSRAAEQRAGSGRFTDHVDAAQSMPESDSHLKTQFRDIHLYPYKSTRYPFRGERRRAKQIFSKLQVPGALAYRELARSGQGKAALFGIKAEEAVYVRRRV